MMRLLTQVGGLRALAGLTAVAWGLHALQQVVDERTARLDELDAQLQRVRDLITGDTSEGATADAV